MNLFLHSIGRRWINRNKGKAFAEENRGPVTEDPTLSAKELLRLNKEEIYCLKKVGLNKQPYLSFHTHLILYRIAVSIKDTSSLQ